jgi:DNA-binding transcriptional regulator GbsR (MarR family)
MPVDARLKSISKDVFGVDYLLPVAVEILDSPEPLSLTQLTSKVGVSSSSSIQGALARLEAGGFVRRALEGGSDRAKPYHRVDSAFWSLVQELCGRTSAPGLF